VSLLELRRAKDLEGVSIEQDYRDTLKKAPVAGSIELFE
jgi:hypothetical protein